MHDTRLPRRLVSPSAVATAVALVAAMTLAGCADPVAPRAASSDALAAPGLASSSSVADRVTFDVAFTIPGGTCGLAATVTGTGTFQMINRASQSREGEWRIGFNWSSHGTATGADGSQYRFDYAANGKWVDVTDPTALPVEIELVDHFNLVGRGGTPDLKVFLHGRFLFDGVDITPIGDPVVRGADVECDPI